MEIKHRPFAQAEEETADKRVLGTVSARCRNCRAEFEGVKERWIDAFWLQTERYSLIVCLHLTMCLSSNASNAHVRHSSKVLHLGNLYQAAHSCESRNANYKWIRGVFTVCDTLQHTTNKCTHTAIPDGRAHSHTRHPMHTCKYIYTNTPYYRAIIQWSVCFLCVRVHLCANGIFKIIFN